MAYIVHDYVFGLALPIDYRLKETRFPFFKGSTIDYMCFTGPKHSTGHSPLPNGLHSP